MPSTNPMNMSVRPASQTTPSPDLYGLYRNAVDARQAVHRAMWEAQCIAAGLLNAPTGGFGLTDLRVKAEDLHQQLTAKLAELDTTVGAAHTAYIALWRTQ